MSAALAVGLVLAAALAFSALVAAIMRRFGVAPVDEDGRSKGFGDVLQKLQERTRR